MTPLYIYTDGSFKGPKTSKSLGFYNPVPIGGWAAVFVYKGSEKIIYGCESLDTTTSNRMEIAGVLKSLQILNRSFQQLQFIKEVVILSDSEYTVNTADKWLRTWIEKDKTHNKKNMDLWTEVYQLQESLKDKFQIEYKWIKGHAGHKYNELVDKMANKARDEQIQKLNIS